MSIHFTPVQAASAARQPFPVRWFISRNFAPLNAMMERADMSERAIYDRTHEVFLHFRLPFEAEPPEE